MFVLLCVAHVLLWCQSTFWSMAFMCIVAIIHNWTFHCKVCLRASGSMNQCSTQIFALSSQWILIVQHMKHWTTSTRTNNNSQTFKSHGAARSPVFFLRMMPNLRNLRISEWDIFDAICTCQHCKVRPVRTKDDRSGHYQQKSNNRQCGSSLSLGFWGDR